MLKGLVAEGAEGQIFGPVALDGSGGALAEDEAFSLDGVARSRDIAQVFVAALEVRGELHDFVAAGGEFPQQQFVFVDLLLLLVRHLKLFDRLVQIHQE